MDELDRRSAHFRHDDPADWPWCHYCNGEPYTNGGVA